MVELQALPFAPKLSSFLKANLTEISIRRDSLHVKRALISDIHGNYEALTAVLDFIS